MERTTRQAYQAAWACVRIWIKPPNRDLTTTREYAIDALKRIERTHPAAVEAAWGSHWLTNYPC